MHPVDGASWRRGFHIFVPRYWRSAPAMPNALLALVVVVLTFAGAMSALTMWEAGRMSDKKIDATKKGAQKHIDEINRQLNPPV